MKGQGFLKYVLFAKEFLWEGWADEAGEDGVNCICRFNAHFKVMHVRDRGRSEEILVDADVGEFWAVPVDPNENVGRLEDMKCIVIS
jgi:hypothetical protein